MQINCKFKQRCGIMVEESEVHSKSPRIIARSLAVSLK